MQNYTNSVQYSTVQYSTGIIQAMNQNIAHNLDTINEYSI